MRRFHWTAPIVICCLCSLTKIACAEINFSVSFDDPNGDLTAAASLIQSHVTAAGKLWASHLVGNANIEVVVHTNSAIPYAEGRSLTSNFVHKNGTFDVFEQGMAAEIRTGVDPNGADPDVEIEINPDYVYNELWFDPDPYARTAIVDINRTDAMSTFLHEFGHALGYNGWINSTNGTYPGNYQSTFDERVSFDGNNFYFNGAEAVTHYGNPVPLTYGNLPHVANFSPRPGEDLILDVMNGLVFYRGSRYLIHPLNIAMLRDAGVPAIYVAGDYNLNGTVDAADYTLWHNSFGSTSTPFFDGNQNGTVDAADYVVWRNNLGTSFGSSTGNYLALQTPQTIAVPEPAAAKLFVIGVAMACVRSLRPKSGSLAGYWQEVIRKSRFMDATRLC